MAAHPVLAGTHMAMNLVQLLAAAVLAALFHALALCIATRLMVEIPVRYRDAIMAVAVEYAAVAVVVGVLLALQANTGPILISAGALTYLFAGALYLGKRLHFADGAPMGAGNGVLVQAIQIPLIIPVLILGSFLVDLSRSLSGA